MAAETIAITLIGWLVVPLLNEFLRNAYNVLAEDTKDKLTELQTVTLPRLEAMMQTDLPMTGNENRLLAQLLKEFVDVTYEIQDAFDEDEYELLKHQMMGRFKKAVTAVTLSLHSKWSKSDSLKKLDKKVSSINSFYRELVAQRAQNSSVTTRMITCLSEIEPIERELLGRHTDIQKLTAMPPDKLKVVVIIGVGGVGKTELAKHIYNRINVRRKMWISFARGKFDEDEMTRCMASLTKDGGLAAKRLEYLRSWMGTNVTGKKVLLVLDDVWYDETLTITESKNKWKRICDPMLKGDPGGMILITTRMDIVAESFSLVSGSKPTRHHLEGLLDPHCLAIFKRYAFGDDKKVLDADLTRAADDIITEIINNLEGMPLAAREAGEILKDKPYGSDWDKIKSNIIQETTRKSLMRSCRMLPQKLQECVVHLSLYPRGFKFDLNFLVLSWMAAGVITHTHQEGSGTNPEDTGRDCFDALVSRSFFQKKEDGLFILHPALHAMSDIITMGECMRIAGNGIKEIPPTIKHLSIGANNLDRYKIKISKVKNLRTLFLTCNSSDPSSFRSVDHDVLDTILKKMKRLRALRLAYCTAINKLPDSVGESKHLRFLDLSNSSIKLLPESVCSVYHLWYLDLNNCELRNVPKDLSKLIKLRYLVSDGETISSIPHIGRLTLLTELKEFHVKKKKGHDLGQLKNMDYLQGALHIKNLEVVGNASDADEAELRWKTQLKEFVPEWSRPEEAIDSAQVLDKLQPHDDISSLIIRGYAGNQTPTWMTKKTKLQTLVLDNCRTWGVLPAFGEIYTNLKNLIFSNCCVDDNTLANCLKNLTLLSHLGLSRCSNITTLPSEEVMRLLTSLESLIVQGCVRLESVGGLQVLLLLRNNDGSRRLQRLSFQNCNMLHLPQNVMLLMQAN